ncbi:MAG: hypothetical protein GY755_16800, partial [Chloroflexi bacterium]|nr:hypothetical protein [Chloroflexota bacterium]
KFFVSIAAIYSIFFHPNPFPLTMKLCQAFVEKVSVYATHKLLAKLNLVVTQRVAYKVTTKQIDAVANNLLNQNFNPVALNKVYAGGVTYLRTARRSRSYS